MEPLLTRVEPIYVAVAMRLDDLRKADHHNDIHIISVGVTKDPAQSLVYALPLGKMEQFLEEMKIANRKDALKRIVEYKRQDPINHYALIAVYIEEHRDPVFLSGRYKDL